eukprot:Clim_evm4s225 gene=Clim_evmTU4s225
MPMVDTATGGRSFDASYAGGTPYPSTSVKPLGINQKSNIIGGVQQQGNPNPMHGAGKFFFRKRRERVNWKNVAALDLDRVIRTVDVKALAINLDNICFADLDAEDFQFLDPNFSKLFRLSQLIIEYLCHSQEHLVKQIETARKDANEIYGEQQKLVEEIRLRDSQILDLRKELKQRRKIIAAYQTMLNTGGGGYHRCTYCRKAFVTVAYLQAHLERRHPEYVVPNPPEPVRIHLDNPPEPVKIPASVTAEDVQRMMKELTDSLTRQFTASQEKLRGELASMQDALDEERQHAKGREADFESEKERLRLEHQEALLGQREHMREGPTQARSSGRGAGPVGPSSMVGGRPRGAQNKQSRTAATHGTNGPSSMGAFQRSGAGASSPGRNPMLPHKIAAGGGMVSQEREPAGGAPTSAPVAATALTDDDEEFFMSDEEEDATVPRGAAGSDDHTDIVAEFSRALKQNGSGIPQMGEDFGDMDEISMDQEEEGRDPYDAPDGDDSFEVDVPEDMEERAGRTQESIYSFDHIRVDNNRAAANQPPIEEDMADFDDIDLDDLSVV